MEKKFIVFADLIDEITYEHVQYKQQAFTVVDEEQYEKLYAPLNISPKRMWKYFTMNEATSANINRLNSYYFSSIEGALS